MTVRATDIALRDLIKQIFAAASSANSLSKSARAPHHVPYETNALEEVATRAHRRIRKRPKDPAVTARPKFGYPALFLRGNMFAGTYQDKIVVRFGDDRTISGAKTAKTFEPTPGRPMKDYVKLRAWIDHAHAYAKTLPKKARG